LDERNRRTAFSDILTRFFRAAEFSKHAKEKASVLRRTLFVKQFINLCITAARRQAALRLPALRFRPVLRRN
jgi:hypothetical protein